MFDDILDEAFEDNNRDENEDSLNIENTNIVQSMDLPMDEYRTSQKEFFIPMLEKARSKDYRVYNGVFKEMYQNCPQLLIPLVNKMFGTNYELSTPVIRLDKDQPYSGRGTDDKSYMSEKYPDSLFEINGQYYHIECECDRDDDIFIRIIHYNMLISYNNKEDLVMAKGKNNDIITSTNMPQIHSGVFYIKNHDNIGEKNSIKSGEITYNLPCFILPRNDLDELIRDNLFLAFPFYMVRYETQLKDKNKIDDIENIKKDDEKFSEGLNNAIRSGILSQQDVDEIRKCTQVVVDHLVADNFDKEVTKTMFKELVDEEKIKSRTEEKELFFKASDLISSGIRTIEELKEKGIPEDIATKLLGLTKI